MLPSHDLPPEGYVNGVPYWRVYFSTIKWEDIEEGMWIAYWVDPYRMDSTLVNHAVKKKRKNDLILRGTNNDRDDPPVRREQVFCRVLQLTIYGNPNPETWVEEFRK